jgi:hypothetical protein
MQLILLKKPSRSDVETILEGYITDLEPVSFNEKFVLAGPRSIGF